MNCNNVIRSKGTNSFLFNVADVRSAYKCKPYIGPVLPVLRSQLRRWCREGRDVTGRTGRKRLWGRGEERRDALENGVAARNGKQNKQY